MDFITDRIAIGTYMEATDAALLSGARITAMLCLEGNRGYRSECLTRTSRPAALREWIERKYAFESVRVSREVVERWSRRRTVAR